MAEPFLAEIRLFAFAFAPRGWAACQGQTLPINQNQALFSLLGTTYGGNGQTTFLLPNIAGRALVGMNASFPQGQVGGELTHTLIDAELPNHTHTIACTDAAAVAVSPAGGVYAKLATEKLYATQGLASSAQVLMPIGGGQPHNNMQPSLAVNFCIALQGIFPSRP